MQDQPAITGNAQYLLPEVARGAYFYKRAYSAARSTLLYKRDVFFGRKYFSECTFFPFF